MGLVAFYDEEEAEERTNRHTVRKQPSASQEKGLTRTGQLCQLDLRLSEDIPT